MPNFKKSIWQELLGVRQELGEGGERRLGKKYLSFVLIMPKML
jgi:hypothetical protein